MGININYIFVRFSKEINTWKGELDVKEVSKQPYSISIHHEGSLRDTDEQMYGEPCVLICAETCVVQERVWCL